MKVIKNEKRLCPCCMEEHDVKTVEVDDSVIFKNVEVHYNALYQYCELTDELYMDEEQMSSNDISMKDAYRVSVGLLTSSEIVSIRGKYDITQSDLCVLLGWGEKTITRYESHQVQDRAHDTILRKIDSDPEWFISLLEVSRDMFPDYAYHKYLQKATALYEDGKDRYLRKTIEAEYSKYTGNELLHGNTALSLDKVVDVIRYFASSSNVSNLYKVKLMKLMWYADALSFKLYNSAITGLVYQKYPMGAVPVGHKLIIDLKDVPCEEVEIEDSMAYKFSCEDPIDYQSLSQRDITVLNTVIDKFGNMSRKRLVSYMHKESAYNNTCEREEISFSYAKDLSI